MDALRADVQGAEKSVLAQTMTFEGDRAGLQFANLLIGSRCGDRRLVVDAFSRYVMSCCFLHARALARDAELRAEVRTTDATHEAMRRAGVRVRFRNPAGLLWRRLPARDHKKLIVIDGRIAYLGGINISDHNFGWHDLMLRIESRGAAEFLVQDFEATWAGRPSARWAAFEGIAIGSLDGRDNAAGFEPVFEVIAAARDEILVESPYLTFPFTDRLRAVRDRGVRVVVITPASHPQPSFLRYLRWECSRSGFDLRLIPGMTHVKAMLIDRRRLVLGSSNFDYLSYRRLREVLAIVDQPGVVGEFMERVSTPDLARAKRARPDDRFWSGLLRRSLLQMAGAAVVGISRG